MDRSEALRDWLVSITDEQWLWFAKRLSANDTGLTGGHQAGFYVPREFALAVAPELAEPKKNPRRRLAFTLVSHDQQSEPGLIYYNSRTFLRQPNGRNEFRVTGFGGASSALQDPDSTGAILVTAWDSARSRVTAWLADTIEEEEAIEVALGPIEPGTQLVRVAAVAGGVGIVVKAPAECSPDISTLPPAWATAFPPGSELTAEAIRRRPGSGRDVDRRHIERYQCEFGLFKVVETARTMPLIAGGFATVDTFLDVAQTVANRRKSRAGRSLELHLGAIFDEEKVVYERNGVTEAKRRPDFLFPSALAYHTGEATRMLGVKTTVKERWRQVLDEASRIAEKHLFTLSEGVSADQFAQMEGAKLRLVVPSRNVEKFPKTIRPKLLTLADFVKLVRPRP